MKWILIFITTIIAIAAFSFNNMQENGIYLFLKKPNNYTFKCGCDLGEVLSANLGITGSMTINYYYMCGGKKLYGILEGNFDKDNNKFIGTYNTENKYFFGPIEFSFNTKGEANGIWDKGVGNVAIHLKQDISQTKNINVFVDNLKNYKMDIQGAGMATIPKATLSENGELYIEYAYLSEGENRKGKMTLSEKPNNRFEGNWKTIADNGKVYQGTLYFIFKANGDAGGHYKYGGSDYKITILTKKE